VWEKEGIMKELTIFMANDGTYFGTAEECQEYEAMPKAPKKDYETILKGITFYTFEGIIHPKTIEDVNEWATYSTAVKIDSYDSLFFLLDILEEKEYWTRGLESCGIFHKDSFTKWWINVNAVIEDYTKLKEEFNK
jgi:hypothetical protein